MLNKRVFGTRKGRAPATTATNKAGGPAYSTSEKAALAQFALTGCFNNTYYTEGSEQLDTVLAFCQKVSPEYIARTAVYARENGFMKDMPAVLAAVLATRDVALMKRIFPRVMDNALQLKKFSQVIRSGVVGRKSFGTAIRTAIRTWLVSRRPNQLFKDSVGGDVTLRDVIKLAHPKPDSEERDALYKYLLDKEYVFEKLPPLVQHFEKFKKGETAEVPDVPFQFLTALPLGKEGWTAIAQNARWHMTRMNLNTFKRHGVFEDKKMVELVARRLADAEEVRKARVFPYQLLMAYKAAALGQTSWGGSGEGGDMPRLITDALQEALEIAVSNVPSFETSVVVCPDVSGSMKSPVTGDRGTATSAVECIDVAALVSAVFLRNCKESRVIPFEGQVVDTRRLNINPRDSVMTNAQKLASIGGGSTNCAAPLELLNREKAKADLVVYVSDNESWAHPYRYSNLRGGPMAEEWARFKTRNRAAKLVCIDLQATEGAVQVKDDPDVLNIAGFSDNVFTVMSMFLRGELGGEHLVKIIEGVDLDAKRD